MEEALTAVVLAIAAAGYAFGVGRLWRGAGIGRGVRVWHATAFALGLFAVAIALLSPLASASYLTFTAHMTQHELLMLVAAPLLVLGQGGIGLVWASPPRLRHAFGAARHYQVVASAWRALSNPVVAFAVHGTVLWAWHLPLLYEAALHNAALHVIQHATFLGSAGLFWWSMLRGRYGRLTYGMGVFYVFLTGLHSGLLGALITLSSQPWLLHYGAGEFSRGVDALHDQHMAGLIMWIPSGLVFILLGLALLAAWLGEAERRAALNACGTARAASGHSGADLAPSDCGPPTSTTC